MAEKKMNIYSPLCRFLFCLCFCSEGSLHLQLLVGLNSRFYLGISMRSYTALPAPLWLKRAKTENEGLWSPDPAKD